jgi:hypothetical protein
MLPTAARRIGIDRTCTSLTFGILLEILPSMEEIVPYQLRNIEECSEASTFCIAKFFNHSPRKSYRYVLMYSQTTRNNTSLITLVKRACDGNHVFNCKWMNGDVVPCIHCSLAPCGESSFVDRCCDGCDLLARLTNCWKTSIQNRSRKHF